MWLSVWLLQFLFVVIIHNRDDTRYEELLQMSLKNPLISMNDATYERFTSDSPRNYTLFVLIRLRGYEIPAFFRNLEKMWSVVAKASKDTHETENALFFAQITNNNLVKELTTKYKKIFAPAMICFPPQSQPSGLDFYDIRWSDGSVSSLTFWIRSRTNISLRVKAEVNIFRAIFAFCVFIGMIYVCYRVRFLFAFINNRNIWSFLVTFFTAIMLGGFMFNRMSSTPFFGGDRKNVQLISHSTRQQFGVESMIVTALYSCITLGLVFCNQFSQKTTKQRISVIAFLGFVISVFLFSRVIKIKIGWHPYLF